MIRKADVAVIGAGIVGIAHAWQAARRGRSVVLFERNPTAQGASVRNFGMILPLGAAPGKAHERAMRGLNLWRQLAAATGVWHSDSGALMVAHHEDEMSAMRELANSETGRDYDCTWLGRDAAIDKCCVVNVDGLLGGLWTSSAMLVDPREVMARFPAWLKEQFGVILRFGVPVKSVSAPIIETAAERWHAERVIVCSGADLGTLFPQVLTECSLVYCKLQMMRTIAQPKAWRLAPALLGGLSLRHYSVFAGLIGTKAVARRIAEVNPELDRWGIHVLAAQNGLGELVIGDSHEYSSVPKWRDHRIIDRLLMQQLHGMLCPPSLDIDHRWHGVYVKHPSKDAIVLSPESGVKIVTGLGGLGMTISFALADDVLDSW